LTACGTAFSDALPKTIITDETIAKTGFRGLRLIYMMQTSSASSRTIAGARIATSIFFLLFGEYKVAGPAFAHGGFQNYLREYIASSAVSFYRPVLSGLVLPHAVFFG
jgi:hypothetical protein